MEVKWSKIRALSSANCKRYWTKVAQALEDGCAEVQKIRSGTVDRLKIVRQEFEEIQSKMEVTMAEYETTQGHMLLQGVVLLEATKCKDEAAEWQAYHEAEYLLQQKGGSKRGRLI